MLPAAALAVALFRVDAGLYAIAPGSAREVLPLIRVDGAETYAGRGKLFLTTVTPTRATPAVALRGWLDPAVEVISERRLVPRGVTEEEYERVSRSLMDESKIAAVSVVLGMVTDYPDEHGAGALVQDTAPGTPAHNSLHPGDLIVAADDEGIRDVDHLARLIRETDGRRSMTLTVEAGGEERTVRVRPQRIEGQEHPILGVVLVANFPFEVVIDSGSIGGPSAGLMWALGVYDILTPGDLVDRGEVAGTGIIDLGGDVRAVGGIEQKIHAAERAGVDLFVLPADNLEAARPVAEDVRLVPVRTLEEAVRSLTGAGA
jgi:Lon-like protease